MRGNLMVPFLSTGLDDKSSKLTTAPGIPEVKTAPARMKGNTLIVHGCAEMVARATLQRVSCN